ncbi:RNA-directed DNA polymerase, eukaryota [Tanacetum coccineum]
MFFKIGSSQPVVEDSQPTLVLDDSCFNNADFSLLLVGKVKEFGSLTNLKVLLEEEGFTDITMRYMGGLWVLFQFLSNSTKVNFMSHTGVNSWFTKMHQASNSFKLDERVTWIDIEGVPLCAWSHNTFVPTFIENNDFDDESVEAKSDGTQESANSEADSDVDVIPDTVFEHSEEGEIRPDSFKANHKPENEISQSDDPPSVGNSGGILCIWDPNMFRKENSTISDYFVAIMGKWTPTDKNLLIISVYAPQELAEKKMLWQYLNHMIARWKRDVIVMGDFNEVRFPEERFGSNFNVHGAMAFNSFISEGGLVEVPSRGYSFTWSHKSTSKMSKLDRFFISDGLFSICPNISVIILDRYLSDHRPILLRESNFDYVPAPFRFFHYWFEFEGFDSFVENTWKDMSISEPNFMLRLLKKLRSLKGQIRLWVKDKNNLVLNLKKDLKSQLAHIDASLDKGDVSPGILDQRSSILNHISSMEKNEALELAQKAKVKWSIEGDKNTKFFHGIINKQRNNVAIRGIVVDGNWIEDPKMVKNEFLSHFADRFKSPCDSRFSLDMEFPNKLNAERITDLEQPFTKEEIKDVVWDCGLNKSSGPDGSLLVFSKGGNSSFITKSQGAKQVKDFRPISLIGCLYKIITKISANRLAIIMGDLVNEMQSAFIANRQILDGPFILNEIIRWSKAKKKQTMIFKVDFEKAFDSVRWDFLDDVLKNFGFAVRWRNWIQSCLKSS